ncbi:phosphatidylserine decarboxylase proenzyme [Candidatus Photodesmus katoptron]|uniref:Phosphatidylserine decarboxylase proenzyme n=1 Tax=Candidatus Photodesmus katoptron Akat1 TaxID=1236703 RepID=S3EIJ3_9GAMM|nr:archaetidylserine decarboxylase [Candidatus Photodesmus katoptron]EPE38008.1 phosphatidylserine decarboxylase [Candidatus Photodesmus katoptron Akat1]KEY90748.1 phosphatidylserine decarboxylase proenzyme [Candidatus Photodesmus katoptron]
MKKIIRISLQFEFLQYFLTRFVGILASIKCNFLTKLMIRSFIKRYNIDMSEVLYPDLNHFKTFNDFFVRELKKDSRPIDEDSSVITYPVDAYVSQFGVIENNQIIQSKGHRFSIVELLGGDDTLAEEFALGKFATFYLSPCDYHRVHMPCDAVLRKMIYIPGCLFSVTSEMTRKIPKLFARNERVVCIFDTKFGPIAQILVGAIIVGSIKITWAGTITPPQGNTIYQWNYLIEGKEEIKLNKGQEMGQFKLGSTVINLFSKGQITFDKTVQRNASILMGKAYAHNNPE